MTTSSRRVRRRARGTRHLTVASSRGPVHTCTRSFSCKLREPRVALESESVVTQLVTHVDADIAITNNTPSGSHILRGIV